MEKKLNSPLDVNEIDFRIQSINKGGYAQLLAYKDARVDMNRLDEVLGVGFWQKKYDLINGNLFCSVGIWNRELNQWAWVQDVGVESFSDKEKGEASDSFKRACFNLGIGRELYDYPVIKVKLKQEEFDIIGDKVKATYKLDLKKWVWWSNFDENGKLSELKVFDNNNELRFEYKKDISIKKTDDNAPVALKKEALTLEHKHWVSIKGKYAKNEITIEKIKEHYELSADNEEKLKAA